MKENIKELKLLISSDALTAHRRKVSRICSDLYSLQHSKENDRYIFYYKYSYINL